MQTLKLVIFENRQHALIFLNQKNSNMTTVSELAKMIDHSILQPTHTDEDLVKQCAIAKKYNVASVCVKPYAVKMAVEQLQGTRC